MTDTANSPHHRRCSRGTRILPTLLLVVGIGSAACGGGGGSDAETVQEPSEIETALASYFGDPTNDTPVSNPADADCIAKEMVALFGEDALRELGVSATQVPDLPEMGMTDVQVGWVLTSFNACIDVTTAFKDALAEDLGDEAASCLTDTLGETVINEMLRASLANDSEQMDNTDDALAFAAS
ncbi:MAG: hypothetical protein ACO23O_15710, partial [Ilumatobacteraceae bacterium]